MKKIYGILLSSALLLGCSEDLLDTQPYDRYTETIYWTSEKNAVAALNGCYAVLKEDGLFGGTATPLWEETATPNAYNYDNSFGFNVIALGTHTASPANPSEIINNRWTDSYRGIGRCNTLLAEIDKVPMSDALKNQMKAETKFLRGLYYSLLEMYYGGVPLILDKPNAATQAELPRNSREEVVQQVLKDLEEAAAGLPAKYSAAADKGRATKGAALGIKARVLLFEASPLINTSNDAGKWTAAANAAKAVMDLAPQAGYDLFPNYRTLFLPTNENNQEVIFDVQFKAPEQTGNSFDLIVRQFNTNAPLRDLIDAYYMKDGLPITESPLYNPAKPYENREPRFYQSIVYPGDTYMGAPVTATNPFKITGYTFKKYGIYDKEAGGAILNAGQSETNYMVLRYADILLMYAEAQNEAIGPDATVYAAINKVRQRAGLVPYEVPAGKTKAQMREIIRRERRIELAGEGFYYTDIRRWKTAEQVLNATIFTSQNQAIVKRTFNPTRDYWWPIPQTQRDLNPNLTQNDVY
ncbi:membrane protein [Adhaeribacter aerolatus]|uniref:Membrane protein n=1 Tax=Adhaeribacter aerolatus TaxID=670289 RepID=A0A512B649_9BACT|nr:RagB/SusD family nutrient uptake outer membrane protein [Adhaeribacter aerolatus]GEO07257.1 membrane protein [Adhaeribacter aerolatus]